MPKANSRASSSKIFLFVRWTLQVIVGLAFIAAATAKLAGAPPMVAIFDQIGIGQWFRYVTAVVELAGGILLLWPNRSVYGAALLTCTMVGALITHFTLIGGNAVPAAVLLLLSVALLWFNRAQLKPAA